MKVRTLAFHLAAHLNQSTGVFVELHRALREAFTVPFDPLPDYLDRDALELLGELGQKLIGRPGPGGGIEPDPAIIALLTLASLIDAERSKVASKTIECWAAAPVEFLTSDRRFRKLDRCPFTKQVCFGEAFATIISDHTLALAVHHIDVSHAAGEMLVWDSEKVLARFMLPWVDVGNLHATTFIGRINFHGLIQLHRFFTADPGYSFGSEADRFRELGDC